jgi:hypothetical protein
MITALIRTRDREDLFNRAIESLYWQTYKDWHVIVGRCNFTKNVRNYVPSYILVEQMKLPASPAVPLPFFYDLYCHKLANLVPDNHWFFFLDDDDFLTSPDALLNISKYLTDPDKPVICQFLRNGVPKPNKDRIKEGNIGLPCLFLHSKHKHLVSLDGYKAGDYRMIKNVTDKLGGYVWAPVVVVETDRRSFGK